MTELAGRSAGIEVLARREGQVLRVVARVRPRRLVFALLACPVVAALVFLTIGPGSPIELRCARSAGGCTVTEGGRVRQRISLAETLRFESRATRHRAELVAVTREATVFLLEGPRQAMREEEVALDRFLRDPAAELHAYSRNPRQELHHRLLPAVLAACLVIVLLAWVGLGDQEVRFDRGQRLAVRRWPLSRAVRRLDLFRAVRVRTRLDEHRERLARGGRGLTGLGPSGGAWRQVVLVQEDGQAWPVTRYVNPAAEVGNLDVTAAELAEFLGLPLTRGET